MEQIELDAKLEKDRAYARERMRTKRAADPEGRREYMRAWRKANPEKIKASKIRYQAEGRKNQNGKEYKEARQESARRWRAKNPGYSVKWRNANPEKARAWYEANFDKISDQNKRAALKRVYGLTLEQRDELFAKQGRACGVCKSATPGSTKGWHIDHCHNTKRVRGIFCNHCNLMLGYAKDNEATLASAIEYLRKSAPQVGYGAN
jgi:hypothetical protein